MSPRLSRWWRLATPAATSRKAAPPSWKSASRCSPALEHKCWTTASLRFHASEFHHLGPFRRLVGDELAEFGRAHRHWLAAEFVEARRKRRLGQHGVDGGIELVD